MRSNPLLTLQNSATQIVDDSNDLFSESLISWSPDGRDIMATVSAFNAFPNTYLLDIDRANNPPNNINETIASVESTWSRLKRSKDIAVNNSLPKNVRKFIGREMKVISYSPDQNKILYRASVSATLPIIIKPRLIGVNSTPETRNLEAGSYYIYDIKEDKNYKMDSANFQGAFTWFTDSRHIIFVKDKALHIMDFDGLNDTIVYAGPFIENYVFPWPDSTKIVVLTNLGNSMISPNLYTISLK
jgi:hypothetical protein